MADCMHPLDRILDLGDAPLQRGNAFRHDGSRRSRHGGGSFGSMSEFQPGGFRELANVVAGLSQTVATTNIFSADRARLGPLRALHADSFRWPAPAEHIMLAHGPRGCIIMRYWMTVAVVVLLAIPAQARQAPGWGCDAKDRGTPDARIRDCTVLIDSRRGSPTKRAVAYSNRGRAYDAKGDGDRALADYNEAIRLDPKYARAYNDRGVSYNVKRDYDRAIADFNAAIRLDPKYAAAYSNRGNAYDGKNDDDRAIADYSEAVRLDPKVWFAYNNRGNAYTKKGDHDRAIADYNEAVRLDPKYALAYINRGRATFHSGALPKALADFQRASELDRTDAYVALWLDIVDRRSNLPSRLAEATKQIDMTKWPAPLIRLYLGQSTPAAVLAAADDRNAATKTGQVCEANFYTGELALAQGEKDEAKRLFGLAAADCPKDFNEYADAIVELKALGASR
jgi:lipoprotein NlpI